ncbi:MAG: hypothetical protein PHD58_09170 [Anaerolineales bacterium]|nr:hypothetical protein [Anaerolineales bacterium]
MRLDRKALLTIAREAVAQRTRADYNVLAAYLCGSLLEEQFLLGGTTDIDLVFVRLVPVTMKREIARLTDEVHLDIAHHDQEAYIRPHQLRANPWLGYTIFNCKPLYDPRHFMDYTQAGVCSQFERPDYVLERARPQLDHARRIWLELNAAPASFGPQMVKAYLRAVTHAANAIALLGGAPLTERRFLIAFQKRAAALGRPGLFLGLLGLLGGQGVEAEGMRGWLPAWREAILSMPVDVEKPRLHPDRLPYYQRALEAMLEMEEPRLALYPLFNTWTHAILALAEKSPACGAWQNACEQIGLAADTIHDRLAALDAYLDLVQDTLEAWARENGA